MIEAVRIIRLAGRAFFDELYNLFVLSILTLLMLVFILPFPPAVVALWAVARRIAEGRIVGLRDWWDALNRYFFPAWGLALINLVVVGLTVYNLGFYGQFIQSAAWLRPVFQGVLVALLIIWTEWQFYTLPILVDQERPHILRALWQAIALMSRNLVLTLILLLCKFLLIALGLLVLGLGVFVLPGMFAVLTVYTTRRLMEKDIAEV